MSRHRPTPSPAARTAFGRGWVAVRGLPVVLQLALALLTVLLVASPLVVTAAVESLTTTGTGIGAGSAELRPSAPERWTVTNVVDGDTLDVRAADGTGERIRVIGIDTPERGECGYQRASDALAELAHGRSVSLVAGAVDDRDRYGRLLRYVDVGSVDTGLELLERGLAVARYDSRDGYGRHPRETVYVTADAGAPSIGCGG